MTAGEIGKLAGLATIRVGDGLGTHAAAASGEFHPPTLETIVDADRPESRGALFAALEQLADQDPLINFRRDDTGQEMALSLYGEVQKEVIEATLAADFGVQVRFSTTRTLCIERPAGVGAAVEVIDTPPNPFLATVGLRVEPAPTGTGVRFGLEVELGSMPFAFFQAVEDTVRATLQQGLHGWSVTDCTVTLTHSGYWPRQSHAHAVFDKSMSSTARDFRQLTPLVLMAALRQAGTTVYEPICQLRLEVPEDAVQPVLAAATRLGAEPRGTSREGRYCVLDGEIPAAQVHELGRRLPGLTRGEGVLESVFKRYRPVRGPIPWRPRRGLDPLDRQRYLCELQRRG